MKVTINGITYEGTEDEIRRIVENPPRNDGIRINEPVEFPDNSERNYPEWPNRTYPWPDSVQRYPWPISIPTNPCDDPYWQRNWDGTPRVTCDDGTYRRHATNCSMDGIVSAFLSDQVGI